MKYKPTFFGATATLFKVNNNRWQLILGTGWRLDRRRNRRYPRAIQIVCYYDNYADALSRLIEYTQN